MNTQLCIKPEVSWKGCLTSPKVVRLESKDEDHMHNLYAQEAQHKESTVVHVKGGWEQEVKNPPTFELSERLWCLREKGKGGTPCTYTKKPMLQASLSNST